MVPRAKRAVRAGNSRLPLETTPGSGYLLIANSDPKYFIRARQYALSFKLAIHSVLEKIRLSRLALFMAGPDLPIR